MKKLYSLFFACCVSGLGFAQPLSNVLADLNANYTSVTSQIPSMYTFAYDGGGNSISDGGNDMYDGGNYLNTNFQSAISYSDNVITASAAFGAGGQYFTRHLPGLFVMGADINAVTLFELTGNNGADGGGLVDSYTFTTSVNCQSYSVFVKRVYNAFDPSINQVIIVPENPSASHTYSTNSDNTLHSLTGIGTNTRIYYLLYAGSSGLYIDNPTTETIVDSFLGLVSSYSGVTASPITNSGATISWTDLGGGTSWDVEYGPSGFPLGAGTIINTASPTVNITGLNASTGYDVYITSDLGDCYGALSFTTLTLCPEPTSPNVTGLSASGATLNWTAGGMETIWDVEWGTSGFLLGAGTQDYGLLTNSDGLTGLTGSTDYHWYVRAVCDLNVGDGVDTMSYFVG
ncbi:MAG: fibronectin type III domain-containing protein, partial [Bacteroidetes bacterium]|nr:fibronectin type III domain-containing protein [Bacteroidota bacterium]